MAHARTLWEEGQETGRQVVVLGAAVALTAAALDVAVGGHVGWFFDLAFVMLCLALALAVRPADFFTVGVMPPLLMVGVFVLVGATRPGDLAARHDGAVQAAVTGLARHSVALIVGYLVCLVVLAIRRQYLSRRVPAHASRV